MNVLFFISPLISRDNPIWQEYFLFHHIENIITVLQNDKKNKFFIVLNNALKEKIKKTKYKEKIEKIYTFSQKELKTFSFSTQKIEEKWFNKTYSEKEMEDYKKIMLNKFEKENFDIIVSFAPVPYLKEIYPKALVLNYEFGIFSREPFPLTFFLDPVGPGGYSYIKENGLKVIEDINLSDKEKKDFANFKKKIKEIVLKNNPFKEKIKKLREKYKYIILLPLQGSNFYLFNPQKDYKTQFEYLEDVLISLDKYEDIGIIVTEHPGEKVLNQVNLDYFKENYSNFIFFENIEGYQGISQLILPFIDAVINVSSTIAYHTLLWGKKLVTIGKTHLVEFSDSSNLEDIKQVLENESNFENREKLFYWLIMNYIIPEEYIKNEEWLNKFLENGMKNKNNLCKFYKPIEEPSKYFIKFIEHMESSENKLQEKIKEISLNLFNNKYMKIWIDTGLGYNENQTYVSELQENMSVKISEEYVKSFMVRFYGINKLKLEKVSLNEDNKVLQLKKEYYEVEKNVFYIDNLNLLELNIEDRIEELNVKISNISNIDIAEILKECKIQKYQVLEKENYIESQNIEILNLEKELRKITREVKLIKERKSYKIIQFLNKFFH